MFIAETIEAAPMVAAAPKEVASNGVYTLAEVGKHKTATDCWVVANGLVLDVTEFLPDHPGGKMAIMAFAGRDATEEFNMVHEEGVVEKYAKQTIIGTLALASKL
jgi:cytochrome b involved in lipid metabolism